MKARIQKYLKTRAVLSPWHLDGVAGADFSAAVVIPALAESRSLQLTLRSLAANDPILLRQILVVVVVNNRADALQPDREDNRRTLDWLTSQPFPGLNLGWIDATTAGLELPSRQGVGLARKLGFDAALNLLDWNCESLLISLDADTLVEPDYLTAVCAHFAMAEDVGAVLPFYHQPGADAVQEEAIRAYEHYLRSYLFGLEQAGSPYAYHSIGSAFACRIRGYVEAGGMNRRLAGEDFYFLQQLNKVGGVTVLRGTVVRPDARFSDRVPFGTGRVIAQHVMSGQPSYRFIDTKAFKLLRYWLDLLAGRAAASAACLLSEVRGVSPELAAFLEERDFGPVWTGLQKNHTSEKQRVRAFHHWFDALRTRQLLTCLTADCGDPESLVADLLSWGGYPDCRDRDSQLAVLEGLQGVV